MPSLVRLFLRNRTIATPAAPNPPPTDATIIMNNSKGNLSPGSSFSSTIITLKL